MNIYVLTGLLALSFYLGLSPNIQFLKPCNVKDKYMNGPFIFLYSKVADKKLNQLINLHIADSLTYSRYISSGKMLVLSKTRDFRSEWPFCTRGIERMPFSFGKYSFHKKREKKNEIKL